MESKIKKPFYKKWWFWLIAAVILIAFIVPESEEKDNNSNNNDVAEEMTNDNRDNEEINDTEQSKETIEVNKEVEFDNINISLENVYVDEKTLSLGFWWSHWKTNEKAHFTVFAYPVVKQNGKELEQTDKNNTLNRKTDKGVDSRVDLKYELIDDSPVTITFKTTTDEPEEESMTIDID